MATKIKHAWSAKAKRGYQGHPIGTVAYYGPTNKKATKVVVSVQFEEDAETEHLTRWFSETVDARVNKKLDKMIMDYFREHKVKSVVMPDQLIGCPHEEGTDYPDGEVCPQCPYWANRNRFTHELED